MNDIGIILQARMNSTRCPAKVLADIGGRTLLQHIFTRVTFLRTPAAFVVATSEQPENDAIAEHCRINGERYFRGSEDHVLDRYYQCAKQLGFRHIVRMTADNPFPDMTELDRLIELHITQHLDFAHSYPVLPIGVGLEIFTWEALERSHREGTKQHHIEHVDEYMLEHPEIFRTQILEVPESKRHPDVRLTVDTPEDLERARYIVSHSRQPWVTTEEAIALCGSFVSSLPTRKA